MKVKTIVKFKDLKEKKTREVGEELEVSKERFKEINSTKFGVLVEEVEEVEEEKETGKTTEEKTKEEVEEKVEKKKKNKKKKK